MRWQSVLPAAFGLPDLTDCAGGTAKAGGSSGTSVVNALKHR